MTSHCWRLTQAAREMRRSLRAGGSEVLMRRRIGLWPLRDKGEGLSLAPVDFQGGLNHHQMSNL